MSRDDAACAHMSKTTRYTLLLITLLARRCARTMTAAAAVAARQRPNALKFSVSLLTWANPMQFRSCCCRRPTASRTPLARYAKPFVIGHDDGRLRSGFPPLKRTHTPAANGSAGVFDTVTRRPLLTRGKLSALPPPTTT